METGKERIGMDIWLAVRNPNYGEKICPRCGHKLPQKQDRYILVEGYFNRVECDGENLLYFAEYEDETDDDGTFKEVLINRRWLGDIIDGGFYEDEENHEFSDFDYYLKDISIFELGFTDDEGDYAFRTEQEAEDWIKEFGRD